MPASRPRALRPALLLGFLVLASATVGAQPRAEPEENALLALAATFPAARDDEARLAIFFGLPSLGPSEEAPPLEAPSLKANARLLRGDESVDAFELATTLDAGALDGRRVQVYGDLSAPPGEYRLALELRVGARAAHAVYPLRLEPMPADRPSVLPPFLIDDEGHVLALYEAAETDFLNPPADYPFLAAGEIFVPDLAPRLGADVPRSRICLLGRGLLGDRTFLETSLVAADGTLLSKERLAMIHRQESEGGSLESLSLGLDTQGLTAGLYQLNVTLHDFEKRGTQNSELSFEIVGD